MNLTLCNEPLPEGDVMFYEINCYWLSNFSSFAVDYMGHRYPTSEHAYQASKFPAPSGIWWRVANAVSAHDAMIIARKNERDRLSNWDEVKRDVMKDICRAKLKLHKYIQKKPTRKQLNKLWDYAEKHGREYEVMIAGLPGM